MRYKRKFKAEGEEGGAIKGLLIISTLGSVLLAKDLPTQLTQLDHHGDK